MSRTVAEILTKDIIPLFPKRISLGFLGWMADHPEKTEQIQEVRFRNGSNLCLTFPGYSLLLDDLKIGATDIEKTLSVVTDCSYHTLENEFRAGYITIPGGHRIGLCGQIASYGDGQYRLRRISGFCFRVARQIKGVAEAVIPRLVSDNFTVESTLVVSPPGCGKTTFLRDLCRIMGEGLDGAVHPVQIGIVDERSEIAGCYDGVPQLDVSQRADVLDRCPKAKGIGMLVRSMNPDVIVTDELGGDEDARAVAMALSGGVKVVASCHGRDLEDIRSKPYSSWLVSKGYFKKAVVLSKRRGPGTVEYAGYIEANV